MPEVALIEGDGIGPEVELAITGDRRTPDLGGTATTAEFAEAVIGALGKN